MTAQEINFEGFSEDKLKQKINILRDEMENNNRKIAGLYNELSHLNIEVKEWREKRDAANRAKKDVMDVVKHERASRDATNDEIKTIKTDVQAKRKVFLELNEKVKKLKKTRGDLRRKSRGTKDFLSKLYDESLNELLNEELILSYEKTLFERVVEYQERLMLVQREEKLITEEDVFLQQMDEINRECNAKMDQVQRLSEESQLHHDEMNRIYVEVDRLREEGNVYHQLIVNRYQSVRDRLSKIDSWKKKNDELRDELSLYLEKSDEILQTKEKAKILKRVSSAKGKLKDKRRMDFDEFKALMDSGDLEL